jgi:hypothetical protein
MKRWLVWHEIEFKQVYNIRVLPNYCILWTIFDWYKVNLKMYNFNLSIKMDFFSGHQSVFHETSASRYWTLPDIYPLSSRTSILQNDLKFCEIAESWLCTFFQNVSHFWFATGGAGFCISRTLALKMAPYAS